MTPASVKPRASRTQRRRQAWWRLLQCLFALGLVLAVAAGLYRAAGRLERRPPMAPDTVEGMGGLPLALAAAEAGAVPAGIEHPADKLVQIEAAVRAFYEADSLEAKLAVVRDAERIRPLMESYYRQQPLRARGWLRLESVRPVSQPGERFALVQGRLAGDVSASVVVEEIEGGRIRVDWESAVQYSEMAWQEFLKKRPRQPLLFRVLASRSERPASSPVGWERLDLQRPGEARVLRAAFDRRDPEFGPLLEQLESGGWKNVPLTLRLCYAERKSDVSDLRIAEVVGKGWLILSNRRS